jgi:hypothetical protein
MFYGKKTNKPCSMISKMITTVERTAPVKCSQKHSHPCESLPKNREFGRGYTPFPCIHFQEYSQKITLEFVDMTFATSEESQE